VVVSQQVTRVTTADIDTLRRRSSYKWRLHPPEILPAFVAEMDFDLATPIQDVFSEAASLGDTGYAWPSPQLAEAFSAFAQRRYGWNVDPAHVSVVPDVMVGVLEMLRLLTHPGDGVVINTPVYPPFFMHIEEARCRVLEAPLALSGSTYGMDFDALERAFKQARVYLLCNPHNPTGCVFTPHDLERVLEFAKRYDITILADEIHAPLVLAECTHVPLLRLGGDAAERTVAFHSASKAWNIPGLKCAQLVTGSRTMRAVVDRLPEAVTFRTGHLGVMASVAAYREGEAWLDDALHVIRDNQRLFARLLESAIPELRYAPPDATYLAWLDCRPLGLTEDPAALFLREGLVALDSGPRYGAPGDGFVRATVATSEALLREIVHRIHSGLRAVAANS
jgi:cystathionine beta-lyase